MRLVSRGQFHELIFGNMFALREKCRNSKRQTHNTLNVVMNEDKLNSPRIGSPSDLCLATVTKYS